MDGKDIQSFDIARITLQILFIARLFLPWRGFCSLPDLDTLGCDDRYNDVAHSPLGSGTDEGYTRLAVP